MSELPKPYSEDPENIEEFRIELPDAAYHGEVPESVQDQYVDSYGPKGRGWKLLAGGAIIITLAGAEYFRRKHGEEE